MMPVSNKGSLPAVTNNPNLKGSTQQKFIFSYQIPSAEAIGVRSLLHALFRDSAPLSLRTLTSSKAALANRSFCADETVLYFPIQYGSH